MYSQRVQCAEPKVKGVAFRGIDNSFLKLHGPDAHERARSLMSRAVADGFRYRTLLPASWYPIAWYRDVLQSFRAAAGAGPDLPRQLGAMSVRSDLSGVYSWLLGLLFSPQALLSHTPRFFKSYYDTGEVEVIDTRRGYAHVRAHGCLGWDENMWTDLAGASEALLEVAGAKAVRMRILCGGKDGDSEMEYEAYWTP